MTLYHGSNGGNSYMQKLESYVLDYYNKKVIERIMDKYNYSALQASKEFLISKTHKMLEDKEMAMWEFSELAIFEIWEVEKITGSPSNSEHIRSEL